MGTRFTSWQLLSLFTLFVCVCAASVTVCATQATGVDAGRLFGLVRLRDRSSDAIPGVRISAMNIGNDFARETITGSSGAFVLPDLPKGLYLVGAELRGFYTVLRVEPLQSADLDVNFWLTPAPIVSCVYDSNRGCGTLSGTVRDYDNVSLRGVKVTFTNASAERTDTVMADALGNFSFSELPPGPFEIVAEQTGFQLLRIPNIRLSDNSYAAQLHLKLRKTSQ